MWIRFTLQERVAGGRFRRGRRARPGRVAQVAQRRARFAFRQRVLALAEGAAYRVAVQYRWYRRDGAVFAAQRLSRPAGRPACCPTCASSDRGAPPR